ncbi:MULTISPECIES: glycosyltransferase family 4 protein [Bacteroides]|uniref:glycosyltransferase family 4 protein n=1 Tax=Bacteroides TaxID=816 RepID=UPI002A7F9B29|nr:glycosyltransferase family 4 protein [Bacteroides nordii]
MVKNIVVSYLGRHGAGAEYSLEMTKGLLAHDCNVYVIISAQVDNLDLWKVLPLKKLFLIPTSDHYRGLISATWKFLSMYVGEIKSYFKNIKVDVLYTPMGHPWILAMRYLAFRDAKFVFTCHDPIVHPNEPLPPVLGQRIAIWMADSVVILSKTFFNYMVEHYKKKRENVVVIPHGAFSHYDVDSINMEVTIPIAKYNFLFFGRITQYKGIEILTEAYRKLALERNDISLRIIGSGNISEYKEALALCSNTVVENRYVGDDEVHKYFSMPNTITVIPYTSASQSGVIPIAMRENSLLIVTNNEGLLEQTLDGQLALISDISVISFYMQMKNAVENFDAHQKIVSKAKDYIDSLSWDNLAKILFDHINTTTA